MKKFFDLNSKTFFKNFPTAAAAFFTAALFFSSCTRNIYLPSAVYAPQLRDKYEGEFGITGNGNEGLQMQTSFALANNFGLQAQANAVSKHSGNVLAGPDYWLKWQMDPRDEFLTEFSAGYSCGTYKKYVARETGSVPTGIGSQSGYMLYDLNASWHGGYFQYSIGARLDNKFSLYTGTRFEFLNCEQFHYQTQFFATDTLHTGQFIPGNISNINTRHGFTTLAEVFFGMNFGWQHFHFFLQAQLRSQYTGKNLNDGWKNIGNGCAVAGITFMFGNKNMPEYRHGQLVDPKK